MLLSSVCLGSSFLERASTSRCPSLLAKIARSMLMVPIFVAFGLAVTPEDTAELGAEGRAAAVALAGLGDPGGLVCAIAASGMSRAAGSSSCRRCFMKLVVLLGIFPGKLISISAALSDHHRSINGRGYPDLPDSSRRTGSVALQAVPSFQGVDADIIGTLHSAGQTELRAPTLECSCHAEAECLTWFAQHELRRERIYGLLEGKISSRSRREHVTRDLHRALSCCVKAQRIVGPINSKWRVDHRQEDLQL